MRPNFYSKIFATADFPVFVFPTKNTIGFGLKSKGYVILFDKYLVGSSSTAYLSSSLFR